MFFGKSGYERKLHLVYLKTQRNRATSVEVEIRNLANDDDDLYDKLFSEYVSRYGYEGVNTSMGAGYVYLMRAEGFHGILAGVIGRYKIGKSNNPQRRHVELNGQQAPCPISCLRYIEVDDMHAVETSLHKRFKANRRHGEYFDFWRWELPVLHLAYNRFANSNRTNKRALPLTRGKNAIAVIVFLFLAAFIAAAIATPQAQEPPPTIRTID